ncbi:MAG: InlB B-repeat-containing protein, partial [Lachnospiraceae bacterium]|nr:InlB B-repeat-containing protein [Lachnospiraceae bacterium]
MRNKGMRGILLKTVSSVLIATQVINTVPMNIGGKRTVYAAEETEGYGTEKTINLHTAGGHLPSLTKEVIVGETYGTLPTPVREGYVFEGWYDKGIEGTKVTETTTVLNTMDVLYAYWTPISVQVDLYGNGAEEFEDTSISVTYGRTFAELPELTKENYEFDGWYTDYNNGVRIANDSLVEFTSNAALYAQWSGKSIEISFDQESAGKALESVKVEYGKPYGELPILSKEGYVFAGWYLSKAGATEITADTLVTEEEKHVLYARWENTGYKVELNENTGENAISENRTVYVGDVYGTLPTPTYDGHTFLGWYTSLEDGATKVTSETRLVTNAPHTLYAKWQANEYDVLLISGIEGEKDYEITVTYGDVYRNLPELKKENYTFLGWYTLPVDGVKVEEGEAVAITSDQVLYAQWEGNA